MRILVCPHQMVMGGSQLNAIELAAAMQNRGHEIVIYAPSGALMDYARELNLEVVESPDSSSRISVQWMLGLLKIVKSRHIDLVHAYEWGPSVATAFSAHLLMGKPMVMTILSMDVPGFLPIHVPIIVGTQELYAEQSGMRPVSLVEPVIDLDANAPQNTAIARQQWKINAGEFVVGVVCRLTTDLEKLEGVLTAIDVCGQLATTMPIRLIIAGDGSGMDQVTAQAHDVNEKAGRQVVLTTGNLIDPSPVYASSDVVVGMGSSALKGMAFGKPLIVQGAEGYWKLLTEETHQEFLNQGWYGHKGNGRDDLRKCLVSLEESEEYRLELGRFGRELVESRFSLTGAAARLEKLYADSSVRPSRAKAGFFKSMSESALEVAKFRTVMRFRNDFRVLTGASS